MCWINEVICSHVLCFTCPIFASLLSNIWCQSCFPLWILPDSSKEYKSSQYQHLANNRKTLWGPLLCFRHCSRTFKCINSFTSHSHLQGKSFDRCRATKPRRERNLLKFPHIESSRCFFSCLSHRIYHLTCGLSWSKHSWVHVRASLEAICNGAGVFLM